MMEYFSSSFSLSLLGLIIMTAFIAFSPSSSRAAFKKDIRNEVSFSFPNSSLKIKSFFGSISLHKQKQQGKQKQQYSCLGGEKRLAKEKTSLYNKASKNHKEVLKCKRIIAHKTKKLNGSQSTH